MINPNRQHLRVIDGSAPPSEAPPPSDAELIDAFERGDRAACGHIHDRLISVVEGTLFRILGRRDPHHEDLVQSAFEQIVLTLQKRRFARACSLSSWAASVTSHIAFNAIRSRTRERKVVDRDAEPETASSRTDIERDAVLRQSLNRVRFHLADMNENRAQAVFLHDVLGHDLAEIAVLSHVSVSAAQSRLVRGRKELKERLVKDGLVSAKEEF